MSEDNPFLRKVFLLKERIAVAADRAGRDPAAVNILPVTKTHPVPVVEAVAAAGFTAVGENRVQEAREKRLAYESAAGAGPMRWELIGHLQSNKARQAVEIFDRIQSVDSVKLLQRLERIAGECGRQLPLLLEWNTGRDPGKFGFLPEQEGELMEELGGLTHCRVEGLMTVAPLEGGRPAARLAFAALRELAERLRGATGLALPELSMGMTADLEEAIAEGATMVRVGTYLFDARD